MEQNTESLENLDEDEIRRRAVRCVKAFTVFLNDPTEENLQSLEDAYKRVPPDVRQTVLGDMDCKDYPIRQAISKQYDHRDIIYWKGRFARFVEMTLRDFGGYL